MTRLAAAAEVIVDATPEDAFAIFTDEISLWWRQNTRYWNDPDRGLFVRIEPGVGGRFLEVYDTETGTGFEAGRVTVWEPGRRLGLTWTQVDWPDGVSTDIDVSFEPAGDGTRVRIEQTGFDRVGPEADESRAGYAAGWKEVLGWFAERANATEDGAQRASGCCCTTRQTTSWRGRSRISPPTSPACRSSSAAASC